MIGAKDLAVPRLNLAKLVYLRPRRIFTRRSAVLGVSDTADLLNPPFSITYSQRMCPAAISGRADGWLFSSIFTRSTHRHNTQKASPGMTWFRLPLFCGRCCNKSGHDSGNPCTDHDFAAGAIETIVARQFDPALGDDPLRSSHLFWF